MNPLILSMLVFYPWALALGVWHVGMHAMPAPGALHSASLEVRAPHTGSVAPVTERIRRSEETNVAGILDILSSKSWNDPVDRFTGDGDRILPSSPSTRSCPPRAPPYSA